MHTRHRKRKHPTIEMPMGPMIDMVFLLLVFFMVSAKPQQAEKDLPMSLPGAFVQESTVTLSDEQSLHIDINGLVYFNDDPIVQADDRQMKTLIIQLQRLQQSAVAAKTELMVAISSEDSVPHQRVIDVMNATAQAGIKGLTFATIDDF